MSATDKFCEVPVVDVNSSNVKEIWPSLVLAVKTATYVALDTELSGLGNRKLLCAKTLPERYNNLREIAQTRSILSLGLSCFKLCSASQSSPLRKLSAESSEGDAGCDIAVNGLVKIKQWTYSVQTFNVVLLCSEDYVVEPAALKFLIEHGFDFNKQYATGVSYYRGKEKTETQDKGNAAAAGPSARKLFEILLWSEVPIVFHNGFVDLVFLYQNLYTDLPGSLQMFLADLFEMFPMGILDTKYIVEFVDRLPATYLEYVFRKWQRINGLQSDTEHRRVCLEFSKYPSHHTSVTYSHCDLPTTAVEIDYIPDAKVLQELVCHNFAAHGWCSKGKKCPKSHAIDLILDLDGIKTAKNRQRRRKLAAHKVQIAGASPIITDDEKNMDLDEVSGLHNSSKGMCSKKLKSDSFTNSSAMDGSHSSSDSVVEASPLHKSAVRMSKVVEHPHSEVSEDIDSVMNAYLETSFKLEAGRSGCHRAGFDAFMTGFIMACLLNKHTSAQEVQECIFGAGLKLRDLTGVDKLINKVYATGKDQPLIISKSAFSATSKNHKERMKQIRGSC